MTFNTVQIYSSDSVFRDCVVRCFPSRIYSVLGAELASFLADSHPWGFLPLDHAMSDQSFEKAICKRMPKNITLLWALTETPEEPKEGQLRASCVPAAVVPDSLPLNAKHNLPTILLFCQPGRTINKVFIHYSATSPNPSTACSPTIGYSHRQFSYSSINLQNLESSECSQSFHNTHRRNESGNS